MELQITLNDQLREILKKTPPSWDNKYYAMERDIRYAIRSKSDLTKKAIIQKYGG